MVELNMVEANQKFMENSEELYDALMESHWQTAEFSAEQDYLTSSLPEPIYCWRLLAIFVSANCSSYFYIYWKCMVSA